MLLVDDDPMLVRALAEIIAHRLRTADVETCTSAPQAVERIATGDYDVVLSDVVMPGIHGLELLAEVRRRRPETLVILVTGADDRELTLAAMRGGAYDFILKPVDPDYVAASIGRAIETRRLRCEVERQQATLKLHAEELERTVEDRTRELREAHRVKDEFLATVSHELRTPLTAILGWARLLLRGGLDDGTRVQAIESVARNARSQAQLIDDLLDVSRIITGKLRLDVQEVDLVQVLESALMSVLPAAQSKEIEITTKIDGELGTIAGDPERLQQVLWNLLANAIKFTQRGGKVAVCVRRAGPFIELVVTDDGSGIRPELLPFVFDRMRQGDASSRGARRGLGLGLAIVRHLVELHGGTVSAASPGERAGSTFTVRLPWRELDARERRLGTRPTTLGLRDSAPESQCLRGVRALVVDDDQDTRDVLVLTLRHAGAVVEAAGSAAEGLARFRATRPDVLLCDIALPDLDGYSLLGEIRAVPDDGRGVVPAIALTAFAKPEDRSRAVAAGFQLHVAKPGPSDLAATVAEMLRQGARDDSESPQAT